MKQPDLGKKIAELRQQKNLTQDELVEKCNVNVRTIQRIEAGEVTPRTSTLRIITEALGKDFDQLFEKEEEQSFLQATFVLKDVTSKKFAKSVLQTAWVAGIIYFVLGLVEAATEFVLFEESFTTAQTVFYVVVKLTIFSSYFFFIRGLVAVGKLYITYMLRISSYLFMAAYFIVIGLDVFHAILPMEDELYLFVQSGASITLGAIGIIFGVGLIRLNKTVGTAALFAGVLELIIAFFFITIVLFFLSLLLLIPVVILEIIVLYKASEQLEETLESA